MANKETRINFQINGGNNINNNETTFSGNAIGEVINSGNQKETQSLAISNQNLSKKLSLNQLIGQGGFGKVYLGYYNNQQVAIKELPFNIKGIDDRQIWKKWRSRKSCL
ncbi:MAG: Serine/threonine-protein kinase PknD [Mycoplasmataceae bacterium]|nr:Serine/threonine-protein kinase PknD [Mycoplasmataceae bacterium]WNE40094.1 MAG: Serine/threonine-protein kinase PknD [Mycoplasmataceae bacterium]